MNSLLTSLLPFVIMVLLAPFVIATGVYFLVRKMSQPEKMLFPLPNGLAPERQWVVNGYGHWLQSQQLQTIGAFRFGSLETIAFRQKGAPRFFSIVFSRMGVSFAVETFFDGTDSPSLETGTSGSTGMFPAPPRTYKQSFPGVTPDVAWQRHVDAEAYLIERFCLRYRPLTLPYEQILLNGVRTTTQYVRSIPFYPFRAVYWFFVSRRKANNRSIQEQFPPSAPIGQIPQDARMG